MPSDVSAGAPAVCSYCLWRLTDGGGERTTCPECGTAYHADCFEENGGCGTFGCPAWLVAQAAMDVADGYEPAWTPPPLPARPPAPARAPDPDPAPVAAQAAGGFCTSCGSALEVDQRFCTSCGSAVQ